MKTPLSLFVIVAILCFSLFLCSCASVFDKEIETTLDATPDDGHENLTDTSDSICEEDKKALAEFINASTAQTEEALRKFDFSEEDFADFLSELENIEFEIFAETSGKKIYVGAKNSTLYLSFDGLEEYIFIDGDRAVTVSVSRDENGEIGYCGEDIELREYFDVCIKKLEEYGSFEAFGVSAEEIDFSGGEYLLCSEYADRLALPILSALSLTGTEEIDLSRKESCGGSDDFRARLSYTIDRGRVTGRFFKLEVLGEALDRLGLDSFCLSSDSRPYAKDGSIRIKIMAEQGCESLNVIAEIDICADNFPEVPAEVISFKAERNFVEN